MQQCYGNNVCVESGIVCAVSFSCCGWLWAHLVTDTALGSSKIADVLAVHLRSVRVSQLHTELCWVSGKLALLPQQHHAAECMGMAREAFHRDTYTCIDWAGGNCCCCA